MRVVVAGNKKFSNHEFIYHNLNKLVASGTKISHVIVDPDNTPGAIGKNWALNKGVQVVEYPPTDSIHSHLKKMADYAAIEDGSGLILFDSGNGTYCGNLKEEARKSGLYIHDAC